MSVLTQAGGGLGSKPLPVVSESSDLDRQSHAQGSDNGTLPGAQVVHVDLPGLSTVAEDILCSWGLHGTAEVAEFTLASVWPSCLQRLLLHSPWCPQGDAHL